MPDLTRPRAARTHITSQDTRYGGYADFYVKSEYARFPQEHRKSVGRYPFQMIMVDQQSYNYSDPSVAEAIVVLPIEGDGCPWSWNMGRGWHQDISSRGRMLVLPPDCESRWEVKGERRVLALVMPTQTIRKILGPLCPAQVSSALRPLSQATWEDALLAGLMPALWDTCKGAACIDSVVSVVADGIATAIVARLFQRSGKTLREPQSVALAPWRMKRVVDYSLAHLDERLSVCDLAEVAGLSCRHFARAFREETGETPHRWIMNQRVERAKHFFERSSLNVTAISEACGFADHSHFIKTFKQITGMTPFRWQQFNRT